VNTPLLYNLLFLSVYYIFIILLIIRCFVKNYLIFSFPYKNFFKFFFNVIPTYLIAIIFFYMKSLFLMS